MKCNHELKKVEIINDNEMEFYENKTGDKGGIKLSFFMGSKKIETKGLISAKFTEANYCEKCEKLFVEYEKI